MTTTASIRTTTGAALGPQLFVGPHRPDRVRFTAAHHDVHRWSYSNKPGGGIWTSSYRDGTSGWVEWCRAENFGGVDAKPWWQLTPDPEATLIVIDSEVDMLALLDRYGRPFDDVMPDRRVLDFDALIATGHAGLTATERGFWACRMGDFTTLGLGLYSWDCESTVWFRWAFAEVQEVTPPR